MKQAACPECGREIRPSNLQRHIRARHLPKGERTPYGTKWRTPELPIRQGRGDDRGYNDICPRGIGPHRYRIYRLRAGMLELVASAPDAGGMGEALVHSHAEHEFVGDDSVGVLDTAQEPGHWVVHPWTLGRKGIRR